MVIEMNVFFNSPLCLAHSSDIIGIEPFRFEMREVALHRGVVQTIASPRHADLGANLLQHVMVSVGRVLEALIAVNDQSSHVFRLFKGFSKRLQDELVVVA